MIQSKHVQPADPALKHLYARLGSIRLLLSDMRRSSSAEEAVKAASRTQGEALSALLRQAPKVALSRDSKANLIQTIWRSGFEDLDAAALIEAVDKVDGKMDNGKPGWSMQRFVAVVFSH